MWVSNDQTFLIGSGPIDQNIVMIDREKRYAHIVVVYVRIETKSLPRDFGLFFRKHERLGEPDVVRRVVVTDFD